VNPLLPADVQKDLVLASRSPRRFDILTGLDFEFAVHPAADAAEEQGFDGAPAQRALAAARAKARDVAQRFPDATVIGADTIVVVDDRILEKPRDDDEATAFLRALSGRAHTVITGVALRRGDKEVADIESTRVMFRELDDAAIAAYVATGEGRDKAGSYAVQGLGAGLVQSIDGCFYNVVGLPVTLLFELMRKI